jgi:hypothetical protein
LSQTIKWVKTEQRTAPCSFRQAFAQTPTPGLPWRAAFLGNFVYAQSILPMLPLAVRKALFFLFFGVFLVSAPLVVLYTAGYRFNRTNNTLSQTGTLSLASTPRGAESIVNGENMGDATPAVLQRLAPGTRTVLLSKEGYHNWERVVSVESGVTTYVTAPLFLVAEPTTLIQETTAWEQAHIARVPQFVTLPNDILLTTTTTGVEVSRTTLGGTLLLALLTSDAYAPLVLDAEDLFVENSKGEVFAISLTRAQSATSVGKNIVAFAWDAEERRLAWTDGLEVHVFSAASETQELITRQSDNITALTFAHDGQSLVIASDGGVTGIDLLSYVDGRMQTTLATFSVPTTVWFSEKGTTAYLETTTALTSFELTP